MADEIIAEEWFEGSVLVRDGWAELEKQIEEQAVRNGLTVGEQKLANEISFGGDA